MRPAARLGVIKGVHTVVWAVFAASILAIPVAVHGGHLPLWLARHNKPVFGGLYLAGIAYALLAVVWG